MNFFPTPPASADAVISVFAVLGSCFHYIYGAELSPRLSPEGIPEGIADSGIEPARTTARPLNPNSARPEAQYCGGESCTTVLCS
jgi:hypothetical protein